MAKPFFDLDRIDADGLRRVGATLRAAGFTEEGVRDRLGVKDLAALQLTAYPYYTTYRLRRREPLDLAIQLFLLQGEVVEEELADLFDRDARKVLRRARLIRGDRTSRAYRAPVSVYPCGDRLLVTDHRFTHQRWLAARAPRDPVMYLGADTYYLARVTPRRQVRAVLDLCTGSGVHAILAAASAERVLGVDVNPRAVNFARLNAVLNDTWNAVFAEGDLFTPVRGERFDLVLANPPFVPSPVYELAYRDGGPSGADVLRRIVAGLPDHLASGGMAQVVTHVAEREGESYLERIRRWLGGANMNLHSLKLGEEDPLEYTIAQTRRAFGEEFARYSRRLVDWLTNLRSQRFTRIVGVVLTLQWNEEAPHPPWTQEDEAKPPLASIAGEVSRLFAAKHRVRRVASLQALDRLRVGVPDDLLLVERRQPTGTSFEVKDYRVLLRRATLSPELDVKALVRELLLRVDNRSTVPQVIAKLAADTGQKPEDLDEPCRKAFLVMFERGLVTLDEVAGAAAPEVHAAAKAGANELVRPAEVTPPSIRPADAVVAPPAGAPPRAGPFEASGEEGVPQPGGDGAAPPQPAAPRPDA